MARPKSQSVGEDSCISDYGFYICLQRIGAGEYVQHVIQAPDTLSHPPKSRTLLDSEEGMNFLYTLNHVYVG